MIELLKDGNIELSRRWLAVLMRVSPEDRAELVETIETHVVELYDLPVSLAEPDKHP